MAPLTPKPVAPAGAFPALLEAEFSYVCNSLQRLGVPAAHVEDLAQDVFLTAFQRFPSYDPQRPIRPWLFGIAFRTAANFRRQASLRHEVAGELPELPCDGPGPEAALEERRARALVLRALEALDDDRRAVFVAHEIDGLSIPEVAEALEIPVNTAYTRLRAARQRFAESVRAIQDGGAA